MNLVTRRFWRLLEVALLLVVLERHGYFASPVSLETGLMSSAMTMLAATSTPVVQPKSVSNGMDDMKPAIQPASLLPNEIDRNHTPIIKPTMRGGDSLLTA